MLYDDVIADIYLAVVWFSSTDKVLHVVRW